MARPSVFAFGLVLTLGAAAQAQPGPPPETQPEAEAADERPHWRKSDADDLSSYGIAAYVSGGFVHARQIGLGSVLESDVPTLLRRADIRLFGLGWSAGISARPFYQWPSGWRIACGADLEGLGGMSLEKRGGSQLASIEFDQGLVVAIEGSFGKAFDAGWSFPYLDLGFAGQAVIVDLSMRVEGLGDVGATRLYAFGAAPFARAGWFVPVDNDFYLDVALHYRAFGVMGGGISVGLGMMD